MSINCNYRVGISITVLYVDMTKKSHNVSLRSVGKENLELGWHDTFPRPWYLKSLNDGNMCHVKSSFRQNLPRLVSVPLSMTKNLFVKAQEYDLQLDFEGKYSFRCGCSLTHKLM